MNNINEECGVVGVFNHYNSFEITKFGLLTLQHRGQEGCGISYCIDNELDVVKGRGLVSRVIADKNYNAIHSIGHVRYSTTGSNSSVNVQPFVINSLDESFSVCHNGNIVNTNLLKTDLENQGSIFHTSSDTELIAHLIRKNKGTRLERITAAVSLLEGAFAFLVLFSDELYVIRDKYGLRPICIGVIDNSFIVSSESSVFSVVGASFVRDVEPGEIIRVNDVKITSSYYQKSNKKNMCSMEYIYFARPDSTIDLVNVHNSRYKIGEELAAQDHIKADIVIGVPDSGLSAAAGYASYSKINFDFGLIKNKYSGRTFIEPTDELRKQGIKLKLSVIESVVKDKIVIVVDDSIVRGNTSRKIVELLKNANAKEVHMRIASPPIKFPCFYGVDFSTFDELISNKYNVESLCKEIKADSLKFIDVDTLNNIVSHDLCNACFTGKYPTELYEKIEDANKEVK